MYETFRVSPFLIYLPARPTFSLRFFDPYTQARLRCWGEGGGGSRKEKKKEREIRVVDDRPKKATKKDLSSFSTSSQTRLLLLRHGVRGAGHHRSQGYPKRSLPSSPFYLLPLFLLFFFFLFFLFFCSFAASVSRLILVDV
jgi:hypothetical protein